MEKRWSSHAVRFYKASGLAWLIVLDAVERLYGDKNVIGSVGRESKPDGAR